MDKVLSYLVFSIFKLISLIPLRVSYVFSDLVLYPIVYYIARYRIKVVRMNLKNSFPEKSSKELKIIERRFYRHFCDSFFDSVRILSMSRKEADERMKFTNTGVIFDALNQNKGVALLFGHYGSWEYLTLIYNHLVDKGVKNIYGVYMPIKSKPVDYLFLKIRTHFDGEVVTKKGVFREVIRLKQKGQNGVFGLISDQSPIISDLNYWTTFLNQDTAFITGFERMARQTDMAVIYGDVRRVKRGHYTAELKLISSDPANEELYSVTEQYAKMMEATIVREPSYWLWTHKRWKHKRTSINDIK